MSRIQLLCSWRFCFRMDFNLVVGWHMHIWAPGHIPIPYLLRHICSSKSRDDQLAEGNIERSTNKVFHYSFYKHDCPIRIYITVGNLSGDNVHQRTIWVITDIVQWFMLTSSSGELSCLPWFDPHSLVYGEYGYCTVLCWSLYEQIVIPLYRGKCWGSTLPPGLIFTKLYSGLKCVTRKFKKLLF